MKKRVDYNNVNHAIKEMCKSQSAIAISALSYEILNGIICAYVSSTALVSVSIALISWYFAKAVTRITSVGSCIKIYEQEGQSVDSINLAYSKAMKSSITTGILATVLMLPAHVIAAKIVGADGKILVDSYIYLFSIAPYCILGNIRKILEAKHTVIGDVHSVKVSGVIYNTVDIVISAIMLFIFKLGIVSVGASDTIAAIIAIAYFMRHKTTVKYVKNKLTWEEIKVFIQLSKLNYLPTLLYGGVTCAINYALMLRGVQYLALFTIADRVQMIFEEFGGASANVYRTLYAIYNSKENTRLLEEFKSKFNRVIVWLTVSTAIFMFFAPIIAIKAFNFNQLPMDEAYGLLLLYMTHSLFIYKFYTLREQLNFYNLGREYTVLLMACSGIIPAVCALIGGATLWLCYTYSFVVGILMCKAMLRRNLLLQGYEDC